MDLGSVCRGGRSSAHSPPAHRRPPRKLMALHLGGKSLGVGSPSHGHSASFPHVSAPSSHPTIEDSGSERVPVMRYLGGAETLPQVWWILVLKSTLASCQAKCSVRSGHVEMSSTAAHMVLSPLQVSALVSPCEHPGPRSPHWPGHLRATDRFSAFSSEVADGLCCVLTTPCLTQTAAAPATRASDSPVTLRQKTFDWRRAIRCVCVCVCVLHACISPKPAREPST